MFRLFNQVDWVQSEMFTAVGTCLHPSLLLIHSDHWAPFGLFTMASSCRAAEVHGWRTMGSNRWLSPPSPQLYCAVWIMRLHIQLCLSGTLCCCPWLLLFFFFFYLSSFLRGKLHNKWNTWLYPCKQTREVLRARLPVCLLFQIRTVFFPA